ncbi:hypothetical protein M0D69_14000 [Caballeronia sp. SEWSISQ10-4 2]|uniref:phage fiber-tail adaptor protein n=1 Tax=Caballeronia sp. SEWSISQ10-4 2 TaxID=2937438 RepID=UPI0026560CE2|nr:hypothetical protein [Caballeronia sp. SEWSISQ10-4 2]MDN7179107.1 hypothetical protein [Caballeronia sp. SEWSISQ10-4 2]
MDIFTKYPAEVWDYDVDFTRSLPDNDFVVSATVSVEPPESLVSSPMNVVSPETVKVWLVDGASGKTAIVTVIATTDEGRVIEQQFQIRVT